MSFSKYRVHEVAKDLGISSKEIAQILTTYATPPKNHMQVLEDRELTAIFEYVTQRHQVADLEKYFEEGKAKAAAAKPAEAKPEAKAEAKPAPAQKGPRPEGNQNRQPRPQNGQNQNNQNRPNQNNQNRPQGGQNQNNQNRPNQNNQNRPQNGQNQNRPEGNQNRQPQTAAPVLGHPSTRVPEKKIVDTRKAVNVNLDRYDERLDSLAPQRADKMQAGKQKIQSRNAQRKNANFGNKRKQEEADKLRKLQLEIAKQIPLTVKIPDEIAVGELASRMKKTGAEVVKQLMKLGIMASLSEVIDHDTAALVAMELNCKVEREVVVTIEERLIDTADDKEEDLETRAPVVVVMGHVDHGKTSLLDRIRKANVVDGEAGGITQHIGAYQVDVHGSLITFLDTPGHEAFTAMRARGAMITDIAILLVAADDGIMPQTIESINHAKAAEIPIIVAINKMDKPGADPDRITQQLTEHGLVSDAWGGDTIICPISAKTGDGIDNLLDMVVLTAEMQELKANPKRSAHGTVIEARLDKNRGPVATLLVQKGTLKQGDVIIAGSAVGRVRAMQDAKRNKILTAGPSVPVEIMGMSEVPGAGDEFHAVADERMARELAEQRKHENKMSLGGGEHKVTLEDLFSQIQEGELKDLNIIVKADVQGSAEAVKASLQKLTNEEVRIRVIHCAVGAINESDIMLAATSNAIITAFNVRPDNNARDSAARMNVDMRMYSVIYDCINEMETAMKGMLAPKFKEVALGTAEIREVYKITGAGIIAGCYITEGKVMRNAEIRLVRDGIVVYTGVMSSLRRFKDDMKEVAHGYECGIGIEKYGDIKVGDLIEAFIMEEVKR